MDKSKRRMRLEIKQISEEGTFEGLLSPYGNVDSGNDVVEKGAYAKTLKDHGNKVPLLWQHKQDSPIGDLTLEDRADGLWARGQLLLDLPDAKKAYLLIKAGIVRGLSIGFQSIKDSVEAGVRHLKEIRLFEGSVVTFPLNELAQIAEVKAKGETKAAEMDDMCEALCRMCRDMCESAIWYCYEAGDEMAAQAHIVTLADCISCCDLCAGAMYRDSASVKEICSLCETICRRTAEACSAFGDDAVMMACADSCNACADCCRDMAAQPADNGMEAMGAKPHEIKAGRMLSATNRSKIQACIDSLSALLTEADADTSEGAAKAKSAEPVDHSKLISTIDELKGVFTWKTSK